MSIESLVTDAIFLKNNGKYESALALVLAAIDASSVKMFPKGTKSLVNVKDTMRPGERFKLCFCYGLKRFLNKVEPNSINDWTTAIYLDYKNKKIALEDVLYSDYRCGLLHEGELPTGVAFIDMTGAEYGFIEIDGFKISIQNDVVILDYKCLDFFINVVNYLPVNGGPAPEELVKPVEFRLKNEFNLDEIYKALRQDYSLSEPRVNYLCDYLKIPGNCDRDFCGVDSDVIKSEFKSALKEGKIPKSAITALRSVPSYGNEFERLKLITDDGVLHDNCINAIRELSLKFEWK